MIGSNSVDTAQAELMAAFAAAGLTVTADPANPGQCVVTLMPPTVELANGQCRGPGRLSQPISIAHSGSTREQIESLYGLVVAALHAVPAAWRLDSPAAPNPLDTADPAVKIPAYLFTLTREVLL